LKVLVTSLYLRKLGDHYGTQPGLASPSQQGAGLASDIFGPSGGGMSSKEIEKLWGQGKRRKRKRRKRKPVLPEQSF